jgi:hypothetical protein
MPIKRCIHWATREFHQFLKSRAQTPFAWGTNDCCLFPADAIHSFTGHDLAEDFRGKYTDEASAFALIKTLTGGTTVEDAAAWCAQKAGLMEWAKDGKPLPLFAKRGDLVVLEDSGRMIAGVVHLNGRHVISVGESGLKRLPLNTVKRAWKI